MTCRLVSSDVRSKYGDECKDELVLMSGSKIQINVAVCAWLKFIIAPNLRNSQTPDLTEYAREGTGRHWLQIVLQKIEHGISRACCNSLPFPRRRHSILFLGCSDVSYLYYGIEVRLRHVKARPCPCSEADNSAHNQILW